MLNEQSNIKSYFYNGILFDFLELLSNLAQPILILQSYLYIFHIKWYVTLCISDRSIIRNWTSKLEKQTLLKRAPPFKGQGSMLLDKSLAHIEVMEKCFPVACGFQKLNGFPICLIIYAVVIVVKYRTSDKIPHCIICTCSYYIFLLRWSYPCKCYSLNNNG